MEQAANKNAVGQADDVWNGSQQCESALLWVDLRRNQSDLRFYCGAAGCWASRRVANSQDLDAAIRRHAPHFLVFDYDHPDRPGLQALADCRHAHPQLPVLMLTEGHSEELAVWALRSRVWDYLVKPVPQEDLCERLTTLAKIGRAAARAPRREVLSPTAEIPESRQQAYAAATPRTAPAVAYIQAHYAEAIDTATLAALCFVSRSTFSRLFHREHGTPFREYLIRYRVEQAREQMATARMPLKALALSVGFCDQSHFTRAFRRVVGNCPGRFAAEATCGPGGGAITPSKGTPGISLQA